MLSGAKHLGFSFQALREPGITVLGLGQGAPHLLPRVGQPALKTNLPPAAGFAELPVGLVVYGVLIAAVSKKSRG